MDRTHGVGHRGAPAPDPAAARAGLDDMAAVGWPGCWQDAMRGRGIVVVGVDGTGRKVPSPSADQQRHQAYLLRGRIRIAELHTASTGQGL